VHGPFARGIYCYIPLRPPSQGGLAPLLHPLTISQGFFVLSEFFAVILLHLTNRLIVPGLP
jgi:hypothetical protein